MAARLLASLIVMGSGIVARAFVQGYHQALASMALATSLHTKLIFGPLTSQLSLGLQITALYDLLHASRSGVAQETVKNIRRASKFMVEPEARQILGVAEHSTWEEILKKYDALFEQNAKNGSFYLQSKVHRAKECLESVYQKKGQDAANVRDFAFICNQMLIDSQKNQHK